MVKIMRMDIGYHLKEIGQTFSSYPVVCQLKLLHNKLLVLASCGSQCGDNRIYTHNFLQVACPILSHPGFHLSQTNSHPSLLVYLVFASDFE